MPRPKSTTSVAPKKPTRRPVGPAPPPAPSKRDELTIVKGLETIRRETQKTEARPFKRYRLGLRRAANVLRRDAGEAYAAEDDKKAKWLRRAAFHVEAELRELRDAAARETP